MGESRHLRAVPDSAWFACIALTFQKTISVFLRAVAQRMTSNFACFFAFLLPIGVDGRELGTNVRNSLQTPRSTIILVTPVDFDSFFVPRMMRYFCVVQVINFDLLKAIKILFETYFGTPPRGHDFYNLTAILLIFAPPPFERGREEGDAEVWFEMCFEKFFQARSCLCLSTRSWRLV